jgi:hypothetical protein
MPDAAAELTDEDKKNQAASGISFMSISADAVFSIANWALVGALVVGVVATYALVVSGKIRDSNLRRELNASRERIAQLNNETAHLRAKEPIVDDALMANAQAGRDAALVNAATRTVVEQLALAQRLVTPERLSEAARSLLIISKVEPFAGKRFDVAVTASNIELETLLGSLRAALRTSGWIEIERSDASAAKREQSSVSVALVRIDASKNAGVLDAAEALASALNAEGIAATANAITETNSPDGNVIHILIGPKPQSKAH